MSADASRPSPSVNGGEPRAPMAARAARPGGLPWAWLALLAIAALGMVSLGSPLNGDTALFHFGAGRLLEGDALYRDWWDLKSPGVYWHHALARLLFGPAEWAIHAWAVLWALPTAWAIGQRMRNVLDDRLAAAAAMLLSVAPYYLAAGFWHQSQPALFAGFALALGLVGLTTARGHGALLGGIALALAMTIKLSAIAPAIAMALLTRARCADGFHRHADRHRAGPALALGERLGRRGLAYPDRLARSGRRDPARCHRRASA
ncbi:MAG: glycosyltransferase family 39 protein [Burkholderiaceae bacterium]